MTSSSGIPEADRPANRLEGLTLDDGWVVVERIGPIPESTGGNFSSSYRVERDGEQAFLKAVDFVSALQSDDPMRELEVLSTRFNRERDLVFGCEAGRMKNVIRVLEVGQLRVPEGGPNPQVSYLVFEMADGDIRRFRALQESIDVAWIFRSLKHAAMGISQLHAAGISHQDLKPSNLLTFQEDATEKIGDLGRATQVGVDGPFDNHIFPGDTSYAPPEFFYGSVSPDWDIRRKATDLFQLGSLMFFQFTGVNVVGPLFDLVGPVFTPIVSGGEWDGSYDDVIPHLRAGIGELALSLPALDDPELDERMATTFKCLCEPDPRLRGHPRNHADRYGNPYALDRFVSGFSAMAARTERKIRLAELASGE
jgi:serine/threonine protein kinase